MNSKNNPLLIYNAKVYTVDDTNPTAEAVLVNGNQIIFVGSNEEAKAQASDDCRMVDANGRTLLPGFIDSHFHLAWGAETLLSVQLYEADSMETLKSTVQTWARENPNANWILGNGLTYAVPTPDEPLTRHHLDAIESERPLALTAFDMHSTFVNSKGLELMGLTHGIDRPLENGIIPVDENGLATGELYEMDAMDFVNKAQPEPTLEQAIQATKLGLALCAQHGITSVHNMDGDVDQAKLYAIMEDQSSLTLRVYIPFWVKPGMTVAHMEETATQMRDAHQSEMVRSNCVKFFMDGVYESYTAVTTDAYPDQPDNFVEPIWETQTFAQFAVIADKLGLQIFVHACGDGAVRRVLDGYETASTLNGRRDSRHRVEHIEMITPQDVSRFKELGAVASMQPLHAPIVENDPDVWPQRIHHHRNDDAFAWRTLRDSGAKLAFGSDWPVVTLSPMLGIWGAVTRHPLGDKSHAQTLAEAIDGYTKDAAYAEFQENKKGQIKVGMWADLVLLSEDIFSIPPDDLQHVEVEMTVCNGRIVYEHNSN